EINANGQAFANDNNNAKCIFTNVVKSSVFTRNNCASGGSPQNATYTVPAGRYSSNSSQADADAQAQNEINANGQAFANDNNNAKCIFWNTASSAVITRNNCTFGSTSGSATYTVPAGRYSSDVSQAAADAQAQTEINNNGQTYANNNAICTFWNTAKSMTANKNDCAAGKYGSPGTYTVPAGTYSSTSSQLDADQRAQFDVSVNYQTYINSIGTCSSETYSVSMDDYDSNMSTIWITVTCNSSSHPARTISPTIAYKYPVNQTSYITKQLAFAANKTSVTFQVSLNFVGAPTIQSYIIQ
ncbi:DUF5977 domain-containing protein, partial [Flavobacterium sp. 270]|uniref:DUF5977 domain-containing protein n=1 Tax=Flavobacterium sp. 270 TaxID=2512114 RepID=UPI001FB90742